MLKFSKPSFEETLQKEWLVTNGIGGYASSSLNGANSRRYHGILVASFNPPTQRKVLVATIEESIANNSKVSTALSSNQYPSVVHPEGYKYLRSFERAPLPRTVFELEGHRIAKTIFMVYGSNTTIVEYENLGSSSIHLSTKPLFVDRDYHSLFQESDYFDYYTEAREKYLKIYSHYGARPLYVKYEGTFEEERFWVKQAEYGKEAYRGLDFHEDTYSIGNFKAELQPGEKTYLILSLEEEMLSANPVELKQKELERLEKLAENPWENPFVGDLLKAGDQFIVHRASTDSYSILAGYHWFTDWGRDTMIAMRGLCIATGNQEVSRSILETFFSYLSEGMLPNRFPDFAEEEVEYNTVDATLWLFVALYEYYQKFEDKTFVATHFDKLTSILQHHADGTRFSIHLTKEGFIFAGDGISQLTWMDARVGDFVVTPRHGCPVEIQALWYNALKIYAFLGKELQKDPKSCLLAESKVWAKKMKLNFPVYFLNDAAYLNDVVVPGEATDTTFRPNQIYVLSLPFSLLKKKEEKQIFEAVQEHLFTPYGLRTLKKGHEAFKAVYQGDQWNRDTAYHQGTIWPFLLGAYYTAQLKLYRNTKKLQVEILDNINVLQQHFYESDGIHCISEIFDGADPSDGRGTIQQAWSVSAILQVFYKHNLL